MLKLLLAMGFGLAIAITMLQLRQQALNLNLQTCRLHGEIESHQARLWSQQMRIAEATAPSAIAQRVQDDHIPLAPANKPGNNNWILQRHQTVAQAE